MHVHAHNILFHFLVCFIISGWFSVQHLWYWFLYHCYFCGYAGN